MTDFEAHAVAEVLLHPQVFHTSDDIVRRERLRTRRERARGAVHHELHFKSPTGINDETRERYFRAAILEAPLVSLWHSGCRALIRGGDSVRVAVIQRPACLQLALDVELEIAAR